MKFILLLVLFGLSHAQHNPQLKQGRTAIVQLFEWRWADTAAGCERFLGPNGFGAVQIFPPNEQLVLDVTPNTGLPSGTYCDVNSGQKQGSGHTRKQIQVGNDGCTHFYISNTEEHPFIAIHADSKLGSNKVA